MMGKDLFIKVSVNKESLLGKIADIEKQAENLRFTAMSLRASLIGDQSMDADMKEPEE